MNFVKRFLPYLFVILLVACSSPTPAPVVTDAPINESYPDPEELNTSAEQPYVDPNGTIETIEWADAEKLILDGQARYISQLQNLEVTIQLLDGRFVKTVEPAYNDVATVIQSCGDPCTNLVFSSQ